MEITKEFLEAEIKKHTQELNDIIVQRNTLIEESEKQMNAIIKKDGYIDGLKATLQVFLESTKE